MITHIAINNYALINKLNLTVGAGFTTFTGETGAGKSILLGAIGLCLGKRADSHVL
ncbi:MAG: AAA family ATPase, partial [Candidatus Hydrogenedentes bacterium]|nr:AAA family ATPase [Candidatus Hydrogenedentota bacterium]